MSLNATLFVQFGVFFILALFTMKFVWPPMMKALDERAKKIADGLAAAEKGQRAQQEAERQVAAQLAQVRDEGQKRISEAEKRAQAIVDEAKNAANAEAARIIAAAKAEADNEVTKAREALRDHVAVLAVKGAEQILKREVNASAHADLLNQLKTEL